MPVPTRATPSGWLVVTLAGRLDAHTAPPLEPELAALAARNPRLALDLGGVDYLSSAGLRVLLATLKACRAGGGAAALLAPRPNVKEVLEVSGFATLFPFPATEGDLAS